MDDDILEPSSAPILDVRNATPFSRYCENILRCFVKSGAEQAVVHYERTEYTIQALYTGLRNACRKNDYRRLVTVHKQEDHIYLLRRNHER